MRPCRALADILPAYKLPATTDQTRREPEFFAVESKRAKASISEQPPPRATARIAGIVPTVAFAGRTRPATDRTRRRPGTPPLVFLAAKPAPPTERPRGPEGPPPAEVSGEELREIR